MPDNDQETKLLEDLYTAAVRRGERDDPAIVRLAEVIEKRRPKAQAKPEQGEAVAKPTK